MSTTYKQFISIIMTGFLALASFSYVQADLNKDANVARAIFTTAIENREPVDQVLILSNQHNAIYFFTDLRHLENQKIIHRWEHEGKVVTSKIFNVNGPRWRVYSKLNLPRNKTGTWTVVVTTEQGLPLKAAVFKYVDGDETENAILRFK